MMIVIIKLLANSAYCIDTSYRTRRVLVVWRQINPFPSANYKTRVNKQFSLQDCAYRMRQVWIPACPAPSTVQLCLWSLPLECPLSLTKLMSYDCGFYCTKWRYELAIYRKRLISERRCMTKCISKVAFMKSVRGDCLLPYGLQSRVFPSAKKNVSLKIKIYKTII
jgi:hypothetical protein